MKVDLFSQLISAKINQKNELTESFENTNSTSIDTKEASKKNSFYDMLEKSLEETNNLQKTADRASSDLATGKSENIHETMLALSQAELSFNLMVQVRNKVLESYQDVMRMQI